jgi:hypothetical protein
MASRPALSEKYHEARRRSFEAGLSKLQGLCGAAVNTLKKNLTCGRPSTEVGSAEAILSHATQASIALDLAERLASLERRMNKEETIT